MAQQYVVVRCLQQYLVHRIYQVPGIYRGADSFHAYRTRVHSTEGTTFSRAMVHYKAHHNSICYDAYTVKSGSQKMQASMGRRWLHELEPMNHLENLGPPRSLCLFPANPKPENIHRTRNTEDCARAGIVNLKIVWVRRRPPIADEEYKKQ